MAAIATVLDESPIRNNPRMKQLLKIHVQKICLDTPTPGTWKPVHADLCIYTTRPAFVQPGDRLALFDLKIQKTNNKGFEQYLIKEGIAASIYLTTLNHIIISRPKISVQRMIWHLKNNLTCRIQEKLSSKTFALFSALFLGNKQLVKKEMDQIKTYYKTWGISHHLARSGLHLVIFIMLWSFLLNLLPLPFIMKDVLLLSICFLYLFLSWTSISFLRAFSTFVLYKICSLNKVSITTIHALTLITWGTLVLNPMQLFSLDFQLSFSLTGALAWFNLVSHAQQTRQKTVDKKQYNALS